VHLSEIIAASYHLVTILSYTIGVVLLSRNYRNISTRLTAFTLFSYTAWAALYTVIIVEEGLDELLFGFALFVQSIFFPLLYLTIRSFKEIRKYDFLIFLIPIVVLMYLLIFEPIGSIALNPFVYFYEVITPLLIAFLIILNITIYMGYQVYREIMDFVTKERFFYLMLSFSLIGYICIFEIFLHVNSLVGLVAVLRGLPHLTGVPHLISLAVLSYAFLFKSTTSQLGKVQIRYEANIDKRLKDSANE